MKRLVRCVGKFKQWAMLVLEYMKRYDHKSMRKISPSSAKLIVNDSDIDKAFG